MSFTFRTRLVSSFYVKDKILKDFFEASESYTESLVNYHLIEPNIVYDLFWSHYLTLSSFSGLSIYCY
jgi:hypothetical protein